MTSFESRKNRGQEGFLAAIWYSVQRGLRPRGGFRAPSLKGVDNPTFAHRLRLPLRGPSGGQTGLPTPRLPPMFLKMIFLLHLDGTAGGCRRACPSGGPQAHGGSGGAAPCRGSRRRRGTRWGAFTTPSGGLLMVSEAQKRQRTPKCPCDRGPQPRFKGARRRVIRGACSRTKQAMQRPL